MEKKIKVLHVVHLVGGVEICVRQIAKNIDNSSINLIVACQNLKNKNFIKDNTNNHIKTYYLPIVREISPIRDIISVLLLIKILYLEKPDAVHVHSAKAGVIGRVANIFFKKPLLYTPHAFSYLSARKQFKKKFFLFIEKILRFRHVLLLATSESEKDRAIDEVGYENNQTVVLDNAINPIQTNTTNSSKVNHKEYICSLGRPSYQKNTEMLLNVFEELSKRFHKLHLYIVGAGEYSPELIKVKEIIATKKITDRVTIIPWITRVEAMTVLKFSKLYVSTSIYEGMPYAVIEALYLQKAMVLTNCDGNKDLIQDNFSGFLVKSKKEMINKISLLLKDDTKRKQFEANAHKEYLKRHQIETYIQKLTKIYKNITK